MADNVAITAGSGTTIATDDVGSGVQVQRVKIVLGADSVNDGDVASGNPMPITAASLPLPSGAATSANQATPYTEDAAAAANPVGVVTIAVRADTLAAVTDTDGDNIALRATNKGELYVKQSDAVQLAAGTAAIGKLAANDGVDIGNVDVASMPAVTNAGTFAVQDSEKIADNAGFTDGTSKVMMAGFAFDETAGTALTENDAAAARVDAKRAQVLVIEDETTRGRRLTITAANAAKVDGSAVTQPVSLSNGTTGPQKAEDAASADQDVGIPAMAVRKASPANTSGTDGDYEFLQMSGGRLWASAVIDTALPSGTNTIGKVDDGTTAASTLNSTSSDGGTALTSSAQAIKGTAGTLMGYYIYNPNTSAVFVQLYNTAAASVTVGTTNPLFMLTLPPGSAANMWMQPSGISFGTAISWSATSTAGGNGAPTTALDAVAWYK